MPDPVGARDLARELGCSVASVTNWRTSGAPHTVGPRGALYDLDQVRQWLRENLPSSPYGVEPNPCDPGLPSTLRASPGEGETSAATEAESLTQAKARKERALATLREYDVRLAEGELLEAQDVKDAWSALLHTYRLRTRALADQLADRIANKPRNDVHQLLREEVDKLLNAIADQPF
jgi:phage terminase Nu1 subunit (DNA packaging protein)